jgi:hypothetical protein
MSTMFAGATTAIAVSVAIIIVLILLLALGSRSQRRARHASWKRYMIRHRVLRDLSRILWGPPRLSDLRDRPED